jgi:hypothetical protein
MKLQDKLNCLSLLTNHITNIHKIGGFWTEVIGWHVSVKIWIHYIAGGTLGHNNIVGHMNGGRPKFIYQDCKCLFDEFSSPIPTCALISSEEINKHV